MVYDGISISGRNNLHAFPNEALTVQRYINEILWQILFSSTEAIGDNFICTDVNHSSHALIWQIISFRVKNHSTRITSIFNGYVTNRACVGCLGLPPPLQTLQDLESAVRVGQINTFILLINNIYNSMPHRWSKWSADQKNRILY